MPKPETKFWHELKRITPQITWTRLENASLLGTPDLLGYNSNQYFFTVELKIANPQCPLRISESMVIAQIFQPQASIRPTTSDRLKRTTTGEQLSHLFTKIQATGGFGFH